MEDKNEWEKDHLKKILMMIEIAEKLEEKIMIIEQAISDNIVENINDAKKVITKFEKLVIKYNKKIIKFSDEFL